MSPLQTRQNTIRTKLNSSHIQIYRLFQEVFCKNITSGNFLTVPGLFLSYGFISVKFLVASQNSSSYFSSGHELDKKCNWKTWKDQLEKVFGSGV